MDFMVVAYSIAVLSNFCCLKLKEQHSIHLGYVSSSSGCGKGRWVKKQMFGETGTNSDLAADWVVTGQFRVW